MALTVEQIAAVSYPAVLAEMRKPANQWMENAALRELESAGFIQHVSLGENIEAPLDYRSNPDTAVLASDQDSASLLKTEVITSAVYDIAQLNVPVTWTKGDEAKNPTETQKIALVKSLLENGINSHDDLIEQRIFTSSAVGGVEVNGLNDLVTTAGTGTVGGIDAGTETFWQNQADTYVDGSDIEASMTTVFNRCAKGSGSVLQPKVLISGSTPHALYESQLQTLQRFQDSGKADGGFKVLAFKSANYIFSHKGGNSIYFLNPKNYQLIVSKQYFRDKGATYDVPGQNAFYFLIYSALQFITNNRSRLGVLSLAS
jgi:hypothetical protein